MTPTRQRKRKTKSGRAVAARPAPPRDFDGIFKALMNAHPRDTLEILCGATLRDGDVITIEPTEQLQPRNRQWTALRSPDPVSLPWIAETVDHLAAAFAARTRGR